MSNSLLTQEQQLVIMDTITNSIRIQCETIAYAMSRPSTVYRPKLSIDGNNWCALYGENLQDGVAGFGSTPDLAMANFDIAWVEHLPLYKEQPTP